MRCKLALARNLLAAVGLTCAYRGTMLRPLARSCQMSLRCVPTLRPYQERDAQKIRASLHKHGSTVYALPTGGGKTIVLCSLIKDWDSRHEQTLVLVHRRELLFQMHSTLARFGVDAAIVAAGVKAAKDDANASVRVAMVQTIARRSTIDLEPVRRIVIDEAHHTVASMYVSVLARAPSASRLGVTATPFRLDGTGLECLPEEET